MVGISTEQQYLSKTKAAAVLNLTRRQIDKLLTTGQVNYIRMPGKDGRATKKIHVSEITKYAAKNKIELNRDTIVPSLGCLRLILMVTPNVEMFAAMPRSGREISCVNDLFSAGLVLGRRWYDVIVFDGDSFDVRHVRDAAELIEEISPGIKMYYVSRDKAALLCAESLNVEWETIDGDHIEMIDSETEVTK